MAQELARKRLNLCATFGHTLAMHLERITIYGLYLNGVCLYIGQTVNEWQRAYDHRKRARWSRKAEFRVLCRVKQTEANRVEKAFIKYYRRKGQAQRNKSNGGSGHAFKGHRLVTVEGFSNVFRSASAAARAIGYSLPTFWKYYRQFGCVPSHSGKRGKKITIVEISR